MVTVRSNSGAWSAIETQASGVGSGLGRLVGRPGRPGPRLDPFGEAGRARGPAKGGGGLAALGGREVGGDDAGVKVAVWRRGEGLVERGPGPDVVLPGEGVAGGDARKRQGLWRRREVERRRVDAEAFEGIADRNPVAEGDHDSDLAGGVGVIAEAEAGEEGLEFASESGGAQGRGAA